MSIAISDLLVGLKEHLFARPQWHPRPGLLTGRVVIITGANTGLGLETAIMLGKLDPALVVLACRNTDRGKTAKLRVMREAGMAEERVAVWELDLASFASVRAFADRCGAELHRLDVLVQNAGIATYKWTRTEDGWESTLQTNVLAPGLLGALLLPLQAKTSALPVTDGMRPFAPHQTFVGSVGTCHGSALFQHTCNR